MYISTLPETMPELEQIHAQVMRELRLRIQCRFGRQMPLRRNSTLERIHKHVRTMDDQMREAASTGCIRDAQSAILRANHAYRC